MSAATKITPHHRPKLAVAAALVGSLAGLSSAWSISGTVQTKAGQKLSGVAITVQDSSKYTATTNSNGEFSLASTTGILGNDLSRAASVKVIGDELVIEGLSEGAVDLSLIDGSGRRIWSSNGTTRQGALRLAVPSGLPAGAAFLRVKHQAGVSDLAVTVGPDGWRVASHLAGMRSLAAGLPTLVFKLATYNDTTYGMSSVSETGVVVVMSVPTTCPFPTTFQWKDNGSAIASPTGSGWVSIKDFTNVVYNGKHYVYGSFHNASAYGSMGMAPFTNWSDAATATQTKMNTSTVAPELMYFTPKSQWILTYQWGSAKFNYMTSSDPGNANSWTGSKALLTEDITAATYGPIDQVPICDATNCYLFYAADNGKIYRASMPKANFPGNFSGSQQILSDTQANLFEAVEVYTVKGTGKYLMIVECMGSARYFRAFSATSLGGTWTPISSGENTPFAGRKNITNPPSWTNDISHGDLVRSHDETRTVDPCNLQLLYQGYAPSFSGAYDLKPYKLGLLTFTGH